MEASREEIRREIADYVKSNEFKAILKNQYKDVMRPVVYGCSISYDMSATQTGSVANWTWGYTTYDKGGYHSAESPEIVVPNGLGGMYLVTGDVSVIPTGGSPATQLAIDISITSDAIYPSGSSSGSLGPLDWASIRFLELFPGNSVSLTGGTASGTTWESPTFSNSLSIIKFPFGS